VAKAQILFHDSQDLNPRFTGRDLPCWVDSESVRLWPSRDPRPVPPHGRFPVPAPQPRLPLDQRGAVRPL